MTPLRRTCDRHLMSKATSSVKPGQTRRFADGTEIFITQVSPGKIPAWPIPADVEYRIEHGKHPGKRFVNYLESVERDTRVI